MTLQSHERLASGRRGPHPNPRREPPLDFSKEREPPRDVWFSLDEALELLATLEDARDALIESGHLSVVMPVETQIRKLSHRLDFDNPQGDPDD